MQTARPCGSKNRQPRRASSRCVVLRPSAPGTTPQTSQSQQTRALWVCTTPSVGENTSDVPLRERLPSSDRSSLAHRVDSPTNGTLGAATLKTKLGTLARFLVLPVVEVSDRLNGHDYWPVDARVSIYTQCVADHFQSSAIQARCGAPTPPGHLSLQRRDGRRRQGGPSGGEGNLRRDGGVANRALEREFKQRPSYRVSSLNFCDETVMRSQEALRLTPRN